MRFLKPMLLTAALLAIAGFALVAIGNETETAGGHGLPSGWYAYDPTTEADRIASDPTAAITDVDSAMSTQVLAGFSLVGASLLLTVVLVTWFVLTSRPTTR